jgi:uncharacterized protein (DUF1697 family)
MLRGINVGGNNMIKMETLRELVTGLGHVEVATYIQSGNVIFKSPVTRPSTVATDIEGQITKTLGMAITVILRTHEELAGVVRDGPFLKAGTDPATLYVIFLNDAPDPARLARLDPPQVSPDEFRVIGKEIHARYQSGYGRSKMTNTFFEGRLGVRGTARNWKTVTKLLELTGG